MTAAEKSTFIYFLGIDLLNFVEAKIEVVLEVTELKFLFRTNVLKKLEAGVHACSGRKDKDLEVLELRTMRGEHRAKSIALAYCFTRGGRILVTYVPMFIGVVSAYGVFFKDQFFFVLCQNTIQSK